MKNSCTHTYIQPFILNEWMDGWMAIGSCYVGPRSLESKEMVLPLIMGKSTCRAKSRKNSGMSRSSATASTCILTFFLLALSAAIVLLSILFSWKRILTAIRWLLLIIEKRPRSDINASSSASVVGYLCSISAHCSMTVSSTLFSRASLNGLVKSNLASGLSPSVALSMTIRRTNSNISDGNLSSPTGKNILEGSPALSTNAILSS
mmetsp:Transcript_22077/g.54246  ORF Transcript_22077/g.54246 Transcript_22077/m.54246 type:complete len:206 (-) Transcript_22077:1307-1924(-)